MELAFALGLGIISAALGALAVHWQHVLYTNPEHRVRGTGWTYSARLGFAAAGCGITTALAFRPDHYGFGPALLTALFCFSLVILSSTDFERRLLPNKLMYPSIIAAALFCWAWPDRSIVDIWIGAGVAAAAGLGLFALGIFFGNAQGSGLGFGDVKLLLLLGLLTGWPAVGPAILMGILLAGLPAVVLIFMGRRNAHFSYGPYLATGGIIVLLFPGSFV